MYLPNVKTEPPIRRRDFENVLDTMGNLSTSPYWTAFFCSLSVDQAHMVMNVAHERGLSYEQWTWHKPDMAGKAHAGGPHQARSSELIITVYHHTGTTISLKEHYALLRRNVDARNNVRS